MVTYRCRILRSIDNFIMIFIPNLQLQNANNEKGTFSKGFTDFSPSSVFSIVEEIFFQESEYFVCDNLGREWVDHISISRNKILFIHSKYKDLNYSASNFQDIVEQAIKKLGNLILQDFQLTSKQAL